MDLEGVTYSNLGNKGPDFGTEGLVYNATAISAAGARTPMFITVNTSDPKYAPNNANEVGMNGSVGYFNVNSYNQSAAKVQLSFRFYDQTWKPRVIESISFMDLDTHGLDSFEYVKL